MPELPEVEAVCRSLQRRLLGHSIRSAEVFRPRTVAPLRVRQFSQRLRGTKISRLERRGKYLVLHLAPTRRHKQPMWLLAHLRMTGNLYLIPSGQPRKPNPPIPPSTSIVLHLSGGQRLVLDDPRGLAVVQLLPVSETEKRLSQLGMEPLSPQFTPEKLFAMTRNRRLPIKVLLMEQRNIAGLGNVYAAEALFCAGIHPRLSSARFTLGRAQKLHQAIVSVLKDAVKSAVRGYRQPRGFSQTETFEPQVYGREGQECRNCGSVIRWCVLRSRSTFYCPHCQRT